MLTKVLDLVKKELVSKKSITFKKVYNFDGAEVCELVGLFVLHKLDQKFNNKKYIGLYGDDGLATFRNMGPQKQT